MILYLGDIAYSIISQCPVIITSYIHDEIHVIENVKIADDAPRGD